MFPSRRFERVARSMEKLPCELHESILDELNFEQLIRLSQFAGTRLTWSLRNSLSPWQKFFADEASTKQLHVRDIFPFLSYLKSDWKNHGTYGRWPPAPTDCDLLSRDWQRLLGGRVYLTTRSTFHDYTRMIEPWVLDLERDRPGSTAILQNPRAITDLEGLIDFMDLYWKLRRTRAEALADELYGLADLYDTHPTRLKQPFAPQKRRMNENHVPAALRHDAQGLVKKSNSTWIGNKALYASRFAYPFPALVPYDWCMQLFMKVLEKYDLSESVYPEAMVEKCKAVLEAPPGWAAAVTVEVTARPRTDPIADLSKAFGKLDLIPESMSTHILKERTGNAYLPHPDADLKWMEGAFPDELQEAREPDWDKIK
ncbi:hypothetical protein K458DRAFT_394338 [Lentithecium fluviatile CBS 122367]|uniref:F-box domain-containing protein n=1 Tax=Lentithecium fluviatile CBS 122367 TaxID=1168545 RepID=A0A6G1IL10_9PLEO|nr:hypothetical protein K458DRAFT_394338 [Lentithecium fluviatile CBS 122367]